MSVSNFITTIREQRGMTRRELARESGINEHTLWGVEAQQRNVSVERAMMIATALEARVEDVFRIKK